MIIEVDHVLVAVPDPAESAASIGATLGLRSAGGGIHPAIGTRNALLSLGGPYLELIGALDGPAGAPGRVTTHPISAAVRAALLADGAGAYVTVALRSDDVAADVSRLRTGGAPLVADVVSRARPDGSVISWPVAFPPRLGPDAPAFLIEHRPEEPERTSRLRDAGPRLLRLEVRVFDPAAVASAWASTLGIRFACPVGGRPGTRVSTPAGGVPPMVGGSAELVATIGTHEIVLLQATPADVGRAAIVLIGEPGSGPPPGPAKASSAAVGSVWFALA